MIALHDFFTINRPTVLFVYGQTFFVLGLAIFVQSRKHSRLRLARDLQWLAAFGVLHGIYEWGDIFIPIQSAYLPIIYAQFLWFVRTLLLALSFVCLFLFGAVILQDRWPKLQRWVILPIASWGIIFWFLYFIAPNSDSWLYLSTIWARYLLGLPGGLLAAYGLYYQDKTVIMPLGVRSIYRTLSFAGLALLAYAILGGFIVAPADFFPANTFNRAALENWLGIPIEVFRSLAGLILTWNMLRVLEIFEIEVDRLIEGMEEERIKAAERERIGQEIHDGAIQAIYSASLILNSITPKLENNTAVTTGLERTQKVLQSAITDLRRYIVSLKGDVPQITLQEGLQRLVSDPRFSSLLHIQLKMDVEPELSPIQTAHLLAIVQESLSNSVRHSQAQHVTVTVQHGYGGFMLQVRDDGQGFSERTITPGFGLRAVKDRARLLGAALTIGSQQGKGTTITVVMPESIIPEEGAA